MNESKKSVEQTRVMLHQGVSYDLPKGVSWIPAHHGFIARRTLNGQTTTKTFTVGRFTFEEAYKRACEASKRLHKPERRKKMRHPIQGLDKQGRNLPLGKGIYMQLSNGTYQMLSVNYGTQGKGNLKRKFIAVGPVGHVSPKLFKEKLQEARELQKKWLEEDTTQQGQTVVLEKETA